jgi:glycosyltransferase involved in cell wall biosynthesis
MNVTFVIPTINRPTLERAVTSVYNQTVPAKLLIMQDPNLSGWAPTRNRAIPLITTPWTAFLDDDDTLDPHYVEWLQAAIDKPTDVVIFQMLQNGADGPIPRPGQLYNGNVGMSYAIRTELLARFPFVPPTMAESSDWLHIKQLMDAGAVIKRVDKVAYYVMDYRG